VCKKCGQKGHWARGCLAGREQDAQRGRKRK
jgi:hypothetical protein